MSANPQLAEFSNTGTGLLYDIPFPEGYRTTKSTVNPIITGPASRPKQPDALKREALKMTKHRDRKPLCLQLFQPRRHRSEKA
jgi:hypothetical protein